MKQKMTFIEYYKSLNAKEKKALAERLDTSVGYLRGLGNGYRKPGVKILLKIEDASYGRVTFDSARGAE